MWLLLALLAAGATAGAPEEVTLCAASSLTDALQEIGPALEAAGGPHIVLNLGASSDLARQIQAGATCDLFFSADPASMEALVKAGRVRGEDRVEVLSNLLAVVVPAGSNRLLRGPGDLAGAKRIAIADPEAVPAGIYARRYLQSAGVWARVADRIVPALNARAALAAVESGHADAGIVYRTDARTSRRVRVAFEVPAAEGPRIAYVLAPVASSTREAARALARYLVSPPALAAYEKQGFLVLVGR